MLNGALVIEMVNNSFSESKKNFGRLRKRGNSFEKKIVNLKKFMRSN